MADPKDCAPEAIEIAMRLGVAVCDCAEAGLELDDIIDVAKTAYWGWYAGRPNEQEMES